MIKTSARTPEPTGTNQTNISATSGVAFDDFIRLCVKLQVKYNKNNNKKAYYKCEILYYINVYKPISFRLRIGVSFYCLLLLFNMFFLKTNRL